MDYAYYRNKYLGECSLPTTNLGCSKKTPREHIEQHVGAMVEQGVVRGQLCEPTKSDRPTQDELLLIAIEGEK